MLELLNKYDLEKMVEVVDDRLGDYSDIKGSYEEEYAGESKVNGDKCYEYGYGKALEDTLKLLEELNEIKKK